MASEIMTLFPVHPPFLDESFPSAFLRRDVYETILCAKFRPNRITLEKN